MFKSARPILLTLAAVGALGTLSRAAEAQPAGYAARHLGQVYAPGYGPAPAALLGSGPRWRASGSVAPDDDGDNAKNPALPSYERGRGQETGGPDRMQIPE